MNTPDHRPTRRRFFILTAGACAALGSGAWWRRLQNRPDTIAPANLPCPDGFHTVVRTAHALGSNVTITVLHRERSAAWKAIDHAFAELDQIEQIMSLYRSRSQISQLNKAGALDSPHPYLLAVLEYAAEISRLTQGAFDITVQPLWQLYRQAQKRNRLPDEPAVSAACRHVDWRRVDISAARVRLGRKGTAITLNGIAQGFAADAAMAALRQQGVAHALIDTGELGALGAKPGDHPWNIGIQHPRQQTAFIATAALQNRCLATSGDYQTRFHNGFIHHHLFNPRTGRSPAELASVSVAAPTAMAADALSTALFVLGPDQGLALLQNLPRTDAFMILKNGQTRATESFPFHS